jgi:hypothetical protein
MSFCTPDASQDLVNARRTAQTYIISGDWDPSAISTEAAAGTLFLGVGPTGVGLPSGKSWQKQDDGCTTNWSLTGGGGAEGWLSGSGAPAGALGSVGQFYVDTAAGGGYVYQKTGASTWTKRGSIYEIASPTTMYVDFSRTDSYTQDGTIARPFKTIMGAVNKIIALGDNSLVKPYLIRGLSGGGTTENVVLEDPKLVSLMIEFPERVFAYVFPAAGKALRSSATNTNLRSLFVTGLDFIGDVDLICTLDGNTFLDNNCNFTRCEFRGSTYTYKGGLIHNAYLCHFDLNILIENCDNFAITGGDGQNPFDSMTIITNLANPKPAIFGGSTFVTMEHCVGPGNVALDALSNLRMREAVRAGVAGATTMTINGTFRAYNASLFGAIVVNNGGFFFNYGSVYLFSALTVNAGGTLDNTYTSGKILNYTPSNGANWVNPDPTNPNDAIDRLAAAVAGLLAAPIP